MRLHFSRAVLWVGLMLAACAPYENPPSPPSDTLRVASHNVHFIRLDRDFGGWSVADWEQRKRGLDALFKEAGADLFAFQEMVSMGPTPDRTVNLARDWLLAQNPEYALAASGDWRSFPTRQPIFYRKDRLTLRDQGWFLYDSPEVVAKDRARKGFWLYFASWADFTDISGRSFRVYNLHFHFSNPVKRRHAARRVAAHMAATLQADVPVLTLGDTNALSGWRTVDILREAGVVMADPPGSSFHFNRGLHILGPIDRVGHTPEVKVVNGPWALRGQRAGDWPSDHYPVVADLRMP